MLSASFAFLRPLKAALPVVLACVLILGALPATALARGTPDGFAELTAKLAPAVVNVSTTQVLDRNQANSGSAPQGDSPFDQFFQDFFDNAPGGRPRRIQSLGSGFIIDPSGIIVTNEHVIDGADEIQVNLGSGENGAGGRSLKAKLIGKDDLTDIALLKVDAPKPLPYVKFGDSDKARVGDWVVAVGDPFGLGGSVTAGIISAFNRDIQAGPYDDFIQTDAAINRGNSGGPLFNMQGEVIGINTAIISPTGGSIGIGFAIPSSIAANVIDQIRKYGHARRGWIGVRIQNVSPDIAEGLGLSQPEGALVAEVTPGGPAAKAGLKPGDLILKFNGKMIATMRALPRLVAQTQIGRDVPVEVLRSGKTVNVTVHVGRLKEQQVSDAGDTQGAPLPKVRESAANTVMGLRLSKLTPELRRRYQIDVGVDGVVITGIAGTSPALGHVMEGDVITEVGSAKVMTPDQVRKEVGAAKQTEKKVVLMKVNHAGESGYRGIRLDEK